jgi:hypothetical protein
MTDAASGLACRLSVPLSRPRSEWTNIPKRSVCSVINRCLQRLRNLPLAVLYGEIPQIGGQILTIISLRLFGEIIVSPATPYSFKTSGLISAIIFILPPFHWVLHGWFLSLKGLLVWGENWVRWVESSILSAFWHLRVVPRSRFRRSEPVSKPTKANPETFM